MSDDKKLAAKEKRGQERFLKVEAGAAEMEIWLKDLLRGGILSLPEREASFFDKIRARMVDAQATGLGNLVRNLRDLNYVVGKAWQSEALEIISKIYLLLEGLKRFDSLDSLSQNDLKTLLGWNVNQKEILENQSLSVEKDNWLLFSRTTELIEDITVQRNWLYGCKNGKFALILNFSFRNFPIETKLVPATISEIELVYVPSALPTRALVKEQGEPQEEFEFNFLPLPDFDTMQTAFAEKISVFPWADEIPFLIAQLTPVIYDNQYFLKDNNNKILPLVNTFDEMKWLNLLAISGGKSLIMFVLRKRNEIIPLGVVGKKRYVML
jgi:hypothetical protein